MVERIFHPRLDKDKVNGQLFLWLTIGKRRECIFICKIKPTEK
jgi:hypothetical protein